MPNFSFLINFQYGRSSKSQKKIKPQTSSSKTNLSSTNQRQISSTNSLSTTRNPNFSPPRVQELRWAFEKFDANKDGKISREEYNSVLKALDKGMADAEIARAFQALDSDGDGFVDFAEFVEMFDMGGGGEGEDGGRGEKAAGSVESAFRLFDVDGDGKISAEELAQVLRRLGEGCSIKACRDMVKGVDSDGDGFINIEEFKRMMSSSTSKKILTTN